MTAAHFTRQTSRYNRETIARQAAVRALQTRQRLGIKLWESVCAFDAAQRIGIEVSFLNVPSMEGMYCKKRHAAPHIVLASERPAGRQHFNCAHEIGHHEHDDGICIDEFVDSEWMGEARHQKRFDPKEFRADRFASFFLMPKSAVERAFAVRGFNPQDGEPEELYAIAGWLGVGYRTLAEHLCYSLKAITQSRVESLRRASLPRLRASIVGYPVKHAAVVDQHWANRSVDVHVGDVIIVPHEWKMDGACVEVEGVTSDEVWQPGKILRAVRQGNGALINPNATETVPLRVSRQGFVGRAIFRHLDDPDEDE